MIRRYAPLRPSRGTVWPPEVAAAIRERDHHCVGPRSGFLAFVPYCSGGPQEIDHVRASHATGKKSRSTEDNGVVLCNTCHRWKTEHGKDARPLLLDYLATFYPEAVA